MKLLTAEQLTNIQDQVYQDDLNMANYMIEPDPATYFEFTVLLLDHIDALEDKS